MQLSENPEAYKFYYQHFLKCVIPPVVFKKCLKQSPTSLASRVDRVANSQRETIDKTKVEFVTEAEETLGLFVLENFSHVWEAQLVVDPDADVAFPKYTTAKKDTLLAQKEQGGVFVANGKKLSNAGTERWNELSRKVAADRARPERKAWEQAVLEEMTGKAMGGRKRPRERATRVAPSTVTLVVAIPAWMTDTGIAGDNNDD